MRLLRAIGRSVRYKVAALVLASTVLALMLSGAALLIYDLRSHERQTSADLQSQAHVLARAAAPALSFNDERTAVKDLSTMQVRPRILAAALYTREGELFASYAKPGASAPSFPARPGPAGHSIQGDQLSVFEPVIENGELVGTVYLRALYEPSERLKDYLTILLTVMVASLAVAVLLSSWLQNAVTEPILEVARVSHRVMERRDFSLRASKTTQDEIAELVDAFNAMLAEIGRREHELREADRRKDEFLATLAHELRNPLAPIRNALEILRLGGEDAARRRMAYEMMARQIAHMVRLVDDLLDVSRITTGKLGVRREPLDLHDAIRDGIETVRPFIEARRHAFVTDLPADAIPLMGDRTRLAQVFSNLLNNAAKYTDPGGRIVLTARVADGDAVVTVKDSGLGLTPEARSRIFDMFEQVDRSLERSQAGLGVGLTLARRLVELHGGCIEAHSAGAGQGSEFVVQLPLAPPSGPAAAAPQAPSEPAKPAARRILLADDNVDFANSLSQLLASRGHDVRIAYDGDQALKVVEQFRPEIAFLDIGMPKVHGYELARRLRARLPSGECLLVAVTGWGQDHDRRRSLEAGFDVHLTKPVDPTEIDSIITAER